MGQLRMRRPAVYGSGGLASPRCPFDLPLLSYGTFLMDINIGKMLTRIFGSRNERLLKRYHRIVDQVNALEAEIQEMTDVADAAADQEIRQGDRRRQAHASTRCMPEGLAIIRESMDRHIGIRNDLQPRGELRSGSSSTTRCWSCTTRCSGR